MTSTQSARFGPPHRLAALMLASTLAGCALGPTAPLPTVAAVDLPRYMGDWYEIARMPSFFQRQCASDTLARYRLAGDGVEVFNRCRRADGAVDSIVGTATAIPGSNGARLRVSFFWPISANYWILSLDDSYQSVLVGEPSRRYAWILSRAPSLDDARVQVLLAQAEALGFDRAAFVRTPQRQPISEAQ